MEYGCSLLAFTTHCSSKKSVSTILPGDSSITAQSGRSCLRRTAPRCRTEWRCLGACWDNWLRSDEFAILRIFDRKIAELTAAVGLKVIINTMRSIYHTTRWLLTASLIVSLGLTGLFPQMMVWAPSGTCVATSQQSAKCCCGTETGFC